LKTSPITTRPCALQLCTANSVTGFMRDVPCSGPGRRGWPDNVVEGERLLREAHALVRNSGPTKTFARCLSVLASARLFAGEPEKAQVLHQEAIGVYPQLGETGS
jgi:hypothetical protein